MNIRLSNTSAIKNTILSQTSAVQTIEDQLKTNTTADPRDSMITMIHGFKKIIS